MMSLPADQPALVRALNRARWLHWGLVGLILFLGLGALQNGGRVQVMKRREADAERRLHLMEARQLREAGLPGWERRAREALEGARESGLDIALRDEWLALSAASKAATGAGKPLFYRLTLPPGAEDSGKRLDAVAISNTPPRVLCFGSAGAFAWRLPEGDQVTFPSLVPSGWSGPIPLGLAKAQSSRGDLLARMTASRQVELVEPSTGKHALTLADPLGLRAQWLAWSSDDRWLAVAGQPTERSPSGLPELVVWDLKAVHAALAAAGLDWSPGSPLAFPAAVPDPDRWIHTTRFLLGGALVFLVMGAAITNQHLLLRRYEQAERAASERARELEEARARMAQAEKMRALGTLAAGVAHDFNNLLSVIQMSRQLVERSLQPTGVDRENLDQIGQAVDQGRAVVRSILGYSRASGGPGGQAPLQTVVSDSLALLQRQFLSGVELVVEIAPSIASFPVDRAAMEPILLNLLVNAAEAMKGRGTVRVAAVLTADSRGCLRESRWRGPWVTVSIADSGPGIPADVLPHVFEPFFTTKKLGASRGTGLGLATVWRIAEESDYGLRVDTEPGRGTRFDLLIPFPVEAKESPKSLP